MPEYSEIISGPAVGRTWRTLQRENDFQGRYELARVQVPQEEARTWAITLVPPRVGPESIREEIRRTTAIVEWGNGESRAVAEVDWGMGKTFSVCGSAVVVSVDKNSIPQPLGTAADLSELAAFIAPADAPCQPPTRTINFGSIGIGGTAFQPIPPFAYKWMLQVDSGNATSIVRFMRRAGIAMAVYNFQANTRISDRACVNFWLPVAHNTTYVEITNNLATIQQFQMVYELALR